MLTTQQVNILLIVGRKMAEKKGKKLLKKQKWLTKHLTKELAKYGFIVSEKSMWEEKWPKRK